MGGFSTVVPPTWVPTFVRYADVSVAATSSYTPAVKGLFHMASGAHITTGDMIPQYYSTGAATWYSMGTYDYSAYPIYGDFIGDGSNFRIYNNLTVGYYIVLMRMG
jgi:hypothetical protein